MPEPGARGKAIVGSCRKSAAAPEPLFRPIAPPAGRASCRRAIRKSGSHFPRSCSRNGPRTCSMTLKERTAAISLAASLILAAAKLAVGLAIGSLALITDALHSCVDFLATGVTWMAVRVADRPADASHPYGHGKFENLAALGEATLLLLLGGGVMVEAVARISAGAPPPPLSFVAVALLLIEIVVNAWRARALRRVGRETQSAAL